MNDWLTMTLLAIDQGRWSEIAGGMRQRPPATRELTWALLALLGVGVIVWIITNASTKHDRRKHSASPLRLFLGLSRAHGLGWGETWALWRLAKSQGLADPGRLFLEPERLGGQRLEGQPLTQARVLSSLRQRLFGTLPEATENASGASATSSY